MSRPYALHIEVTAPAPAPICKKPVTAPKKKAKQTEAQKDAKSNEWKIILLDFYNDKKGLSQTVYAKIKGLKETTFKRHWRECGLAGLKKNKDEVSEEQVNHILACHFANKRIVSEKAREQAAKLSQYLTDDEQVAILQMCGLVALIGTGGVTDDDQLAIVNEIVSDFCDDVEEEDRIHVCRDVLKRMQEKFKDIVKIKTPASIDPKRAEKATEDTRDSMFSKMEYFVELLNKLGHSPWNSYADVPAHCKYGMDEVGTDTTKRMGKILVPADENGPIFQVTPEGDNKMNHHITLCITTRADGKKENMFFKLFFILKVIIIAALVGCWGGGLDYSRQDPHWLVHP